MMIFHYAKTQNNQATVIFINILMVPVMLFIFQYLGKGEPNFEDVYLVTEKMAIAVMIILTGVLIWLLKTKDKFEIYVTEDEFYSHHPVFKAWCFSVNPKDIVEIKNELIVSSNAMTNINVLLKSGQKVQVCQNYDFSLNALYSALKKANPNIGLPGNFNTFKRKLNKDDEDYVSTRFPVTTRIIKIVSKCIPGKKNSLDTKNRQK